MDGGFNKVAASDPIAIPGSPQTPEYSDSNSSRNLGSSNSSLSERITFFETLNHSNSSSESLQISTSKELSLSPEDEGVLSPRTRSFLSNVQQIISEKHCLDRSSQDDRSLTSQSLQNIPPTRTRSKSMTHAGTPQISRLSLPLVQNVAEKNNENRSIRKLIRQELKNSSVPKIPQKRLSDLRSHSSSSLEENKTAQTDIFELIRKRLQCIRQVVEENQVRNGWTTSLLNKLDDLIGPAIALPTPFSDLTSHQLKLFLDNYEKIIQQDDSNPDQKKIIALINLAIGGKKPALLEKILDYLKSLNHAHGLSLDFEKFATQIENSPSTRLKGEVDFSHRELKRKQSSDEVSFDKAILKTMKEQLLINSSIDLLDPDEINRKTKEAYRNRILALIDFIPNIQDIKMSEFLVISQSPRLKAIGDVIQSRHSTLLMPLLFRLEAAIQALYNHMKPLNDTSLFSNQLHLTLKALSTLDEATARAWKESCQPHLSLPPNLTALKLFLFIITPYQDLKTPIAKILALALTGNEETSLSPLLNMLRSWENLKFDTLTADLWAIVSKQAAQEVIQGIIHRWELNTSELLPLKHIPRTFFGIEDIPSTKRNGPTEIIPMLVTINREPLKQNDYHGTCLENQTEFFGQLLSRINKKGFNPSLSKQEQDEQIQNFVLNRTLACPLLTILLGFSTVVWKLKGRDCIDKIYPDLNQSCKYLALRTTNGKGEIHFSVRTPQNWSCSQPLDFTIFPRLKPNDEESTAFDDKRPIADIVFDWTSFVDHAQTKLPVIQNGKETVPALFALRMILRITQLEFTEHATQEDRMHVYEALHMLDIVMGAHQEGRNNWLEHFSPRQLRGSRQRKGVSSLPDVQRSPGSPHTPRNPLSRTIVTHVEQEKPRIEQPKAEESLKEKRVSFHQHLNG